MYALVAVKTLAFLVGISMASPIEPAQTATSAVQVAYDNPLIFYHGRWDENHGTWWGGSGLKLHVQNLKSLTLNLGEHTTSPYTPIGVSVNYSPFVTVNVSAGTNTIPLDASLVQSKSGRAVVRIASEGWQNNRVQLESVVFNAGARLLPYTPSKLTFQFIGDSLSSGQYLEQGQIQSFPFVTGEYFKAEHNINAQPGAALADIPAWGNVHGISYQFFRTEDTGYYYTTDHNYTTPWDFSRDRPQPTHVVIHIGANDASQNVTGDTFEQTYLDFVARLRTIYHAQPIFVFTPWGWPNADGSVGQYYEGIYQKVVDARHALGDKNVFLVDTTGWVTYSDINPDNSHPTPAGYAKIAGLFEVWLAKWGLKPQAHWATEV